jgi:hypothetical protein
VQRRDFADSLQRLQDMIRPIHHINVDNAVFLAYREAGRFLKLSREYLQERPDNLPRFDLPGNKIPYPAKFHCKKIMQIGRILIRIPIIHERIKEAQRSTGRL